MLLKISDGNGGWHLFDNIDRAYMIATRKTVKSIEELNRLLLVDDNLISLVAKEAFSHAPIDVGVIEYVKENGAKGNVMFTKVAYFCNADGHTIEKMQVGR